VIFVHGCFWHGHGCKYFKVPKTRTEFWLKKIQANKHRDSAATNRLADEGWNVIVVWECAVKTDNARRAEAIGEIIGMLKQYRSNSSLSIAEISM
jgi:DNA mismatch endonuclease (patch repair protein)